MKCLDPTARQMSLAPQLTLLLPKVLPLVLSGHAFFFHQMAQKTPIQAVC